MRVISQNGLIDVPHGITCFRSHSGTIYMNMAGDTGKGTVMAEYSSPEKAQKAMEMMHKEYTGIMPSPIIDHEGVIDMESMEELRKSKVGAFIHTCNHGDVECHMLPRIFKFPADDEIEVHE